MSCLATGSLWEVIAQIATALAVIVAIIGLVLQIRANQQERKHQHSTFRLDSALEAFNQASELLRDGNNDRDSWIAAARAVERGLRIAKGISVEEHRDLYEVQLDRYRRIFGDFLGYNNRNRGANFFYGDATGTLSTDDAAIQSTQHIDGRPPRTGIPESVLRILFMFAEFPEDYEDPISKDFQFPVGDIDGAVMRVTWPGLVDYLRHIRAYRAIGGRLHEIQRHA
jgi:hypothetical protein